MTTPANPTPEPTPLTDAAKFRIFWDHNSAHYRVTIPNLDKADVVPAELSADLERQLSDTRRRLAEVEKEREEVRTAMEQIKPMLKLGIGVFNRTVLKGGDAGCAHKENASHASSTLKSQGTRHNETTKTSASDAPGDVQSVTTGPDYTALRNAADGMQTVLLSSISALSAAYAEANAEQAGDALTAQQCSNEQDEWRNKRDAALAAYAALISEGNQPSNQSNSPTASRESQG